MLSIYHRIAGFFKRKRRISYDQIATRLPKEVLAALAQEATFLRGQQVEVRGLAHGEEPKSPHAADPEVDAKLIAQAPAP